MEDAVSTSSLTTHVGIGDLICTYLSESFGPPEINRITAPINMHRPEWTSINDLLLEVVDGLSGYAVHNLGEHDLLLVFDTR